MLPLHGFPIDQNALAADRRLGLGFTRVSRPDNTGTEVSERSGAGAAGERARVIEYSYRLERTFRETMHRSIVP